MKLIFLPGMDGTGMLLAPLQREFNKKGGFQVISYPADRRLSYEQLIDHVNDRLPRKDDFILVAESFSGPIGQAIASSPPGNLKGAIFVATFISTPNRFIGLLEKLPLSLLMKMPATDFVIKRYLLGDSIENYTVDLFRKSLKRVKGGVLAYRVREMARLKGANQRIEVPCAYIVAGSDRLVPRSHVEEFRRLAPDMELVEIPGPHFILQAQPKECAKVIERFLATWRV